MLTRLLINALTLVIITYIIDGFDVTIMAALVAAVLLGIVNAVIRPIVLFLTLPLNVLTLGLFTFIVNALMLWLVAGIVKGFTIHGFWAAFFGALLLSLISSLLTSLIKDRKAA